MPRTGPAYRVKKEVAAMKKSAAAALILMVLLFVGAYLTAREPD